MLDINNIQDAIKSILKPHLKLERLSGTEIHPAARQSTLSAGGREDDDCEYLFHIFDDYTTIHNGFEILSSQLPYLGHQLILMSYTVCRELDISAAKAVAADGGLFAGTTKGLNW